MLRSGELSPDIGDAASLPGKDYHLGAITLRNCSAPSDADLQTIGKAVHLRELDLSGTKMSDKGAEYLAELKSLRILRLSSTEVSDLGLESLQGLKELQSLSLYQTRITPRGLEALKALTGLKRLWLCSLQVSAADVDALEKLLPGCRIVTDQRVALWAFQLGGAAGLQVPGERLHNDFREAARLPQRPFRVIGLDFRVERRLQDADLEYLAGFPGLESLMLMNGTALTDASMRHVGSLKSLRAYS